MEAENTEIQSKNEKTGNKNTFWLILISVFLFILVSINIYDHIVAYQKGKTAQALVETQGKIISNLMTSYESDAYGSSVDRIAEQQLIASEYTITGLQIIGLQNNQIIELLATNP